MFGMSTAGLPVGAATRTTAASDWSRRRLGGCVGSWHAPDSAAIASRIGTRFISRVLNDTLPPLGSYLSKRNRGAKRLMLAGSAGMVYLWGGGRHGARTVPNQWLATAMERGRSTRPRAADPARI